MARVTINAVVGALLATLLALGLLYQATPAARPLLLAGYLLVVGALAVRVLVRFVGHLFPAPGPSPLDRALARRPARPRAPQALERLARMLALASSSDAHAHTNLRPLLREVASDRLDWRLGVRLDAQPERARAVLGEAAWELVKPGREAPEDRTLPGPPAAVLAAAVAGIEQVPER